ncbi:MAG TPA: hypothetical protein PKC28_05115 [Bdellovibrionales bacterium]|nr:hypothetical protein [Bdellovibrionales bacterium]
MSRWLLILNLFIGAGAFAGTTYRVPVNTTAREILNIKMDCEDGIGRACHDYSLILAESKNEKDRRRAPGFVRRACTLRYLPACEPTAVVKSESANGKGDCFGQDQLMTVALLPAPENEGALSVSFLREDGFLYRQGLRVGDVILTVNDQPLGSAGQIGPALEKGFITLNLIRQKSPMKLRIACPASSPN